MRTNGAQGLICEERSTQVLVVVMSRRAVNYKQQLNSNSGARCVPEPVRLGIVHVLHGLREGLALHVIGATNGGILIIKV